MTLRLKHVPDREEIDNRIAAGVCEQERKRLQAIWAFHVTGSSSTASALTGLDLSTVQRAVHRFNAGGVKGLAEGRHTGRPRLLAPEQEAEVKQAVVAGPEPESGMAAIRGKDVQALVEERYGVEYCLTASYNLMHRLGLSSQVPRPSHPKVDREAQEAFKKGASRPKRKRSRNVGRPSGSSSGSKTKRASG